ncbi:MAG: DUF2961 domain-containing protein [Candidatus Omnitrophica bacterium COP1]|nr:DUF2961 domain-containing protein [Candidatus Omnitrophica bacterium COP1]
MFLRCWIVAGFVMAASMGGFAQNSGQYPFSGLDMNLGNLARLSNAVSRSISAENFTGEKGKAGMATEGFGAQAARDLGQGWKVSPAVHIDGTSTFTLADIEGPGAIQSIWITGGLTREVILRMYWDNQEQPSVEVPIPDFFACGWGPYVQINSIPVNVNPKSGFNCFWQMPFKKHCRITLENRKKESIPCYFQINYTLTDIPADAAYFHAQFRRVNPLPYKQDYTIVDGIRGKGHYVGTYMARQVNNNGWWGEGEIKFFMDGDEKFPTIAGTGTEDYFGGSYNFDVEGKYVEYTAPFLGMPQVIRPDGTYRANQRFGLYRWHVMDPIRFEKDLKVTIQALGWRNGGRYLPLQDDIASVAYWYQTLPTAPFPPLPDRDFLEIQ